MAGRIFSLDRRADEPALISTGDPDKIASGGHNPSISADGQTILYETTIYFQGDYECPAIVLHDVELGLTRQVAKNDCDQRRLYCP